MTPRYFRPDIEGLRGLAIILVVVFHALPTVLGGGFVGVDVFFVISGFLITGLLVRELNERGRISLGVFYARRIRRLLPAAIIAIGVTLLLSAIILPPLAASRVAVDGVSATLSVSNIRFALEAGDYFAALGAPSPFLHYWSLSVEEQFYLVWPAMLFAAFLLARSVRAVKITVAAVAAISLALAVGLTDTAPNWAFFSLPTRAWQLALGGLLALAALERFSGRSMSGLLAAVGWLGIVAVLVAGIGFDESLAYPGTWALLPTLGAAAIIAGGNRRFGPGWLLTVAPMRFFGRISYSLYLWHWPLLVLPAVALGGALTLPERLFLVLLAVVIATASTVFVEEPIRRGSARTTALRQLGVVGALMVSLFATVALGYSVITSVTDAAIAESRDPGEDVTALVQPTAEGPRDEGPGDALVEISDIDEADEGVLPAPTRAAAPVPSAAPKPRATPKPGWTNEATPRATRKPRKTANPTPRPRRRDKATPRPIKTPAPKRARTTVKLPANVKPSLWHAAEDEEVLRNNGCLIAEKDSRVRDCRYDPGSSRKVIALVGDSHASHWYPALRKVATDRGWRLASFVKVSCPFTDVRVKNLRLKREYRECARFNENVVTAVKRLKPDLVVTSLSRWQHPVDRAYASPTAQGAGIARMLNRLPGRKVVIADVPYPGEDVPECLSANLKDVRRCAVSASNRSAGGSPLRERVAAQKSKGAFLDFGQTICGGKGTCPVVNQGRIVFRDHHHMTATFSRWLAPAMERALTKVLRKK